MSRDLAKRAEDTTKRAGYHITCTTSFAYLQSTQQSIHMLAELLASSTWNEYVIKRNLAAMVAMCFSVHAITSSNIPILSALLSSRLASVVGMYKILSRFRHLALTDGYRSYCFGCFKLQYCLPCQIDPVFQVDLTKVSFAQLSFHQWPCYARSLYAYGESLSFCKESIRTGNKEEGTSSNSTLGTINTC